MNNFITLGGNTMWKVKISGGPEKEFEEKKEAERYTEEYLLQTQGSMFTEPIDEDLIEYYSDENETELLATIFFEDED